MVTCTMAAIALLAWPGTPSIRPVGGGRWYRHSGAGRDRPRLPRSRLSLGQAAALPAAAAVCLSPVAGVVVGLVVGMLTGTIGLLVRFELALQHRERGLSEMLAATRTLSREVRSGAEPAAAVLAGAAAHAGTAGRVLQTLAVAITGARGATGGLPDAAMNSSHSEDIEDEIVHRLARGWALSAQYGVPWAALIETVSIDLDDRLRAAARRRAQVSGPRVSGYVLAVLPALGILLGAGMGANPLSVLLFTGAGHLMLLVGCTLSCAGLLWTARIVRG